MPKKKIDQKMPKMTMKQVRELTPEQLNKATKRELQHYVKTLSNVANRRIKNLESKGLSEQSPAYISLMRGGKIGKGEFKYKNKTLNQLRTEFKRADYFLGNKTSLITPTRSYVSKMQKKLGGKVTPDQLSQIGRLFNEFKKQSAGLFAILGKAGSEQLFQAAKEIILNDNSKVTSKEYDDRVIQIMGDKSLDINDYTSDDLRSQIITDKRVKKLEKKLNDLYHERARVTDEFAKYHKGDKSKYEGTASKRYKIK